MVLAPNSQRHRTGAVRDTLRVTGNWKSGPQPQAVSEDSDVSLRVQVGESEESVKLWLCNAERGGAGGAAWASTRCGRQQRSRNSFVFSL